VAIVITRPEKMCQVQGCARPFSGMPMETLKSHFMIHSSRVWEREQDSINASENLADFFQEAAHCRLPSAFPNSSRDLQLHGNTRLSGPTSIIKPHKRQVQHFPLFVRRILNRRYATVAAVTWSESYIIAQQGHVCRKCCSDNIHHTPFDTTVTQPCSA
jgi:hypothetical protein